MTKEDKQIIDRATKENWRIFDRTRLKHLLKENLKLYCENELLGERCNQLLKDKGELTDQIADIKANCDLAIEGRDIKIKELEQKLEQTEKDLADYQFNYPKIKELEKENAELRRDKEDLIFVRNAKADHINELKEQIEKMKCCGNCKHNSYWGNELHCNYGLKEALKEDKLVECNKMDKWEIRK